MSIGKTGGSRTNPDQVWGQQAPFLQSLWQQAQGLAGRQGRQGGIGWQAQNLVNGLMQQNNPQLSGQIQGLGADIGQFFQQQIMPGLAGQASGAEQYGQPRHQIAQGMASQDMLRQFSQGATNLRSASYENQGTRASQLFDLGMAPSQAQWSPLQNFAELLGGPVVLGQGGRTSSGWNASL